MQVHTNQLLQPNLFLVQEKKNFILPENQFSTMLLEIANTKLSLVNI